MSASTQPEISIIIKALNEERHIRAAIESALAALRGMQGEIILADSGSTDRTVEIASNYCIRIVQLANPAQRCCGVGPQLGFQFARGKYIYILDGDMELNADFIGNAVRVLKSDPTLAGVAGLVEEASAENHHFRGRQMRGLEGRVGACRWLDMGGLYRRDALRSVGYMSNRNLYSCEEQELGLRLSARGWKMRRLSCRSVFHHGHTDPTFTLQLRRIRSGYLYGPGQVLRSALGTPYFWSAVAIHHHLIATLGLWLMLIAGILLLPVTHVMLMLWVLSFCALFAQRVYRYRSFSAACIDIVLWHVDAIALVLGALRPMVDPMTPVDTNLIFDGKVPQTTHQALQPAIAVLPES
ncbi:MAG: glycosyltransferase [Chromatiales bacterium]|jgi:glycosyltransferase involved in cell wall biosynthesis|nr:glycosyltransferase [Chromatiales bacterium]